MAAASGFSLAVSLRNLTFGGQRRHDSERRAERRDVRDRDRDRRLARRLLDEDDRELLPLLVEAEAQRLDVHVRAVEREAQRRLRHADADLRAPVHLGQQRLRPRVGVEDVARLVGERLDVRVVGALVARDPVDRDRDVLEDARDHERDRRRSAAYLDTAARTRSAGGIAGYGQAVERDDVHQRRQVLALDDHRRRRAAVRPHLVVGHDAVHEHARRGRPWSPR